MRWGPDSVGRYYLSWIIYFLIKGSFSRNVSEKCYHKSLSLVCWWRRGDGDEDGVRGGGGERGCLYGCDVQRVLSMDVSSVRTQSPTLIGKAINTVTELNMLSNVATQKFDSVRILLTADAFILSNPIGFILSVSLLFVWACFCWPCFYSIMFPGSDQSRVGSDIPRHSPRRSVSDRT